MNNQTDVSIRFKNSVTGEKKLEQYAQTLSMIKSVLGGIDKGAIQQMEQTASSTKSVSSDVDKMSKNFGIAFDYTALRTFSRGLNKVVELFNQMTARSTSFLEDFNLFQVAFRGNYTEATKFVNKLSEMYGLDEDWLVKTTSQFKQLSNAMGLANETGEKLSKLMTEMSIDISSLYNMDVDQASSILQSALAGQTKPVRRLGGDITQATLQQTLSNLNIDTQVSQLSYVEKRLLIIISLTQQLSGVTNDWGRTLESPANQIRIMNEQWHRLQRNVGNLFMAMISKVLPYLNAILMVLTEIIKTIGMLLGFKIDDFDYFDEATTGAVDFEDALDGAAESAKKLKQGLRGFDKLNVITTPSSGGGASGGAGGGGIDPRLLSAFDDAFDSYNKKLKDVEMKATKIRDRIMEWLGFTKEVDKETGEVSFKFKKITGGTILGALAVGGAIYTGVSFIYKTLKRIGLLKFTGIGGGLLKSITKIIEAFKVLGDSDGIKYLFLESKLGKGITALTGGFKALAAAIGVSTGALAAIIAVIVAVVAAFVGVIKVLKDAYEKNEEFREKVDTMVQAVSKLFYDLYVVITNVMKAMWEVIEPIWTIMKETIEYIVGFIYDYIVYYFTQIAEVITGLARFFDAIVNGDFDAAFDALEVMVENLWENFKKFAKKTWEKLEELGQKIIEKVYEFVPKMVKKFEELLKWFEDLPNKFFEFMGEAIGTLIRLIATTDWKKLGDDILKGIYNGLVNLGKIGLETLNFIRTTLNKIWEAIWNIDWGKVGKAILDGIVQGMLNFGSTIKNWADSFVKGIKKGLGIHSPAKLIIDAKIGDYSMDAIMVGMEKQLPKLKDEAENITKTLKEGIKDATIKTDFNYDVPNLAFNSSSLDYANGSKSTVKQNMPSINPTIIVQVGNKDIAKQVITDLQDMAKDNGKPIYIG